MDLNHARLPIPPHPQTFGRRTLFFQNNRSEVNDQSSTSTSTPMLRAVPATERIAAPRSKQFRSGILIFAISSICAFVFSPTFDLGGPSEPCATFTAPLISPGPGRVFVINVKVPSKP